MLKKIIFAIIFGLVYMGTTIAVSRVFLSKTNMVFDSIIIGLIAAIFMFTYGKLFLKK